MTIEEIINKLPGLHQDDATDILIKHDMKWKIVGMNGKHFPTKDEGEIPNRVLLTYLEEHVETARMG